MSDYSGTGVPNDPWHVWRPSRYTLPRKTRILQPFLDQLSPVRAGEIRKALRECKVVVIELGCRMGGRTTWHVRIRKPFYPRRSRRMAGK